jgi:hypothetical protein
MHHRAVAANDYPADKIADSLESGVKLRDD